MDWRQRRASTFNRDGEQPRETTASYMKKKDIGQLFEAMMTALMFHKPEDHLHFLHHCLQMSPLIPRPIPWTAFLTAQSRQSIDECLSPFSSEESLSDQPILFLLSSTGTLNLSARLLERYNRLIYLSIEEIDGHADERFSRLQRTIEEHRLDANAFLLAGHLTEAFLLDQWKEQLGRLDAVLLLSTSDFSAQDSRITEIDANDDFENILRQCISVFDRVLSSFFFVDV